MNERLRARYLALAAKTLARTHIAVHRLTRGRLGCHWDGGDVAFITTTGRRTGRPHTTPLACIHHRDGIAVVASNGGSYRPPDWWLNLQNQPLAEVELAGTKHAVVARIASTTEQTPLTDSFGQAYPRFERYRQRSRRAMPVVVLTAIHTPTANATPEDVRDLRVICPRFILTTAERASFESSILERTTRDGSRREPMGRRRRAAWSKR